MVVDVGFGLPTAVGLPIWPEPGILAPGDHVIIDAGDCRVLLVHLMPGSISVSIGDDVVVGDRIGEVGTSGNSSQPHLHIHAIDDDGALRLRFKGIHKSGRHGQILHAAPSGATDQR